MGIDAERGCEMTRTFRAFMLVTCIIQASDMPVFVWGDASAIAARTFWYAVAVGLAYVALEK
jgi:hypothetical protein